MSSEATNLPIVVRDLHKSYRRGSTVTPVLQGIELEVEQGQCVFLVGPSGSGKSTLLSILGCVLSHDSGDLRILGHDVATLNESSRARLRRERIGFVFQRFHLIRGLSALDNVCVPLTLRGLEDRAARHRAADLLEAVGLSDKLHSHPRNLSSGQCQRVALARALAGDPDIILADEPTASLDAAAGTEVVELLKSLTATRGKTAIVVTHDARIFDFADRILRLDGGRIHARADARAGSLVGSMG